MKKDIENKLIELAKDAAPKSYDRIRNRLGAQQPAEEHAPARFQHIYKVGAAAACAAVLIITFVTYHSLLPDQKSAAVPNAAGQQTENYGVKDASYDSLNNTVAPQHTVKATYKDSIATATAVPAEFTRQNLSLNASPNPAEGCWKVQVESKAMTPDEIATAFGFALHLPTALPQGMALSQSTAYYIPRDSGLEPYYAELIYKDASDAQVSISMQKADYVLPSDVPTEQSDPSLAAESVISSVAPDEQTQSNATDPIHGETSVKTIGGIEVNLYTTVQSDGKVLDVSAQYEQDGVYYQIYTENFGTDTVVSMITSMIGK